MNVHTAWGNGDALPVTAHPDGRFAVIRIPNETRRLLSGTLSFCRTLKPTEYFPALNPGYFLRTSTTTMSPRVLRQ